MHTERIGSELQDTLVELSDLASQAKQLHWNVTGRHFRSLHEQLDELTAEVRSAADTVAERAVAIGYAPDARVGTVAKESPLAEIPNGKVDDVAVVELVVRALDTVAARVTRRVLDLAEFDLVSQDLLIGILAGLEKQRWMFNAQQS
ncbi:MAG: Ferritin Dps family protein [Pseudonocardia sp.]|nr:Ferritin Dps family protein [Pseudonocardia sp.]